MRTKVIIIGAGIGGLAAGAALKEKGVSDFLIVDKVSSLPLNLSNGVHYLHSNDFGTPFKFELKKIPSSEEIWHPRTDKFSKVACVPEMIDYSMKVMGTRHPSSIGDPGNRQWETYLPESNNMNDLLRSYCKYIGEEHFRFNVDIHHIKTDNKIIYLAAKSEETIEEIIYESMISTAPLNAFSELCEVETNCEFKNQPLFITNYKAENIVPNWLISLYVSDNQFPPYRITVLNNIISMESLKELTPTEEHIVWYHLSRYFDYSVDTGSKYKWETGRIFGLAKSDREKLVADYKKKDIYLLGRFGRWDGKMIMDTTITQATEIVNEII